MKAIVLVGGEGTRLRPLTETMPKPLIPFMDRPFLHHVLDHLGANGVREVVLSSPYLEHTFAPFLAERHGEPRVTWITEREPLGTGGAIVNALPHVGDEAFFVLNGDILTDLDLTAMAAFHRARGAVATISLARVEDARPFGLVQTDGDRVLEFREKPADPIPGQVNSGTYVLRPEALDGWHPGGMISIEREIYPALIASGAAVHGFLTAAYWMDLGTPEKYLQAHFDVLEGRVGGLRYPAPYRAAGARVDLLAHLGRWVVVGEGARVGPGAQVDDSVLHPGASVGERAKVVGSILGPGSSVGPGATVTESVLAEGATVEPGAALDGAKVSPRQTAGPTGSS